MLRFLAEWSLQFGPLRVFDSIIFRSILGLFIAFVLCLLVTPYFIRRMRRDAVTENVSKDLQSLQQMHSVKKGTPTMGGLMIVLGMTAAVLLCCDLSNWLVWTGLVVFLGYAGLGFLDDLCKLKGWGKRGLNKRQKLAGQFFFAIVAVLLYASYAGPDATKLLVPFTKWAEVQPDLGWAYYPFFVLVIVGCSNAVNLTDGLDGLAAGCMVPVTATFAALAYVAGTPSHCAYFLVPYVAGCGELGVLSAALIGALLGFLWFNAHPARLFMGDTGSLAIGGALAYVALASKQELILPVAGGIFVAEALSVVLQVFTFRTWGKRYLLCAPLHHHLELSGWSENHVVVRLWMIGGVLAAAGVILLKMH